MCSPQHTCETTLFDAPPGDAAVDARVDGPIDSPINVPIDAPVDAAGPQLIAHYRLDGTLDDVTGMHPATMVGSSATYVTGFTNQALQLPAAANSHMRVADSPAFDLPSGRIELRFRYDEGAPAGELGLFSRDANGSTLDGHIGIRLTVDRRVVLRIQRQSSPTVEAYRCTAAPLSAGTWHHVDVTFGPSGLVLRTDGGTASGTSWTNTSNATYSCTTAWTAGMAGNDNPIIIGALTLFSSEGTGLPVSFVAGDVELDDIKIWALP